MEWLRFFATLMGFNFWPMQMEKAWHLLSTIPKSRKNYIQNLGLTMTKSEWMNCWCAAKVKLTVLLLDASKTDGMSFPGFHPKMIHMLFFSSLRSRCKAQVRTVPAELLFHIQNGFFISFISQGFFSHSFLSTKTDEYTPITNHPFYQVTLCTTFPRLKISL